MTDETLEYWRDLAQTRAKLLDDQIAECRMDEQERHRLNDWAASLDAERTQLLERNAKLSAMHSEAAAYNREVERVWRERVEELRGLLRECQYSTAVDEGMYEDPTRECHCCCYPEESGKHADNCRLAAALEEPNNA